MQNALGLECNWISQTARGQARVVIASLPFAKSDFKMNDIHLWR